ncbi:pre-mRNA splicing protein, putative [Babesia caballi]|uniref:Pre-mRNA splicing protein, putative n=1 Tax=Babesia caballi TaxID=5871 RepID=A0AAV4LZK7_BABCB|nr:pre-mRNA splicing protein, putative [Babesia caballi]
MAGRAEDSLVRDNERQWTVSNRVEAEGLEWLYADPSAAKKDTSNLEAYLLGKSIEGARGELGREKIDPSAAGSLLAEASEGAPVDDTLNKFREDPLFIIKKVELHQRQVMQKYASLAQGHRDGGSKLVSQAPVSAESAGRSGRSAARGVSRDHEKGGARDRGRSRGYSRGHGERNVDRRRHRSRGSRSSSVERRKVKYYRSIDDRSRHSGRGGRRRNRSSSSGSSSVDSHRGHRSRHRDDEGEYRRRGSRYDRYRSRKEKARRSVGRRRRSRDDSVRYRRRYESSSRSSSYSSQESCSDSRSYSSSYSSSDSRSDSSESSRRSIEERYGRRNRSGRRRRSKGRRGRRDSSTDSYESRDRSGGRRGSGRERRRTRSRRGRSESYTSDDCSSVDSRDGRSRDRQRSRSGGTSEGSRERVLGSERSRTSSRSSEGSTDSRGRTLRRGRSRSGPRRSRVETRRIAGKEERARVEEPVRRKQGPELPLKQDPLKYAFGVTEDIMPPQEIQDRAEQRRREMEERKRLQRDLYASGDVKGRIEEMQSHGTSHLKERLEQMAEHERLVQSKEAEAEAPREGSDYISALKHHALESAKMAERIRQRASRSLVEDE